MKKAGQGTDPRHIDPRYTIAVLLAAGLLQMSSVFPIANESGWLAVAGAVLIIIPVCIMYGKLVATTGPRIFTYAFGKIPGTVVNLLYVLFFIFSASIDMRQVSNLISGGMFPGLSPLVLPLLFAPVLFYAAKKDSRQVATLGFILFISTALLTGLDLLLQAPQIKFDNYLPLFDTSAGKLGQALFYCVTVVMGKIPILLFILPGPDQHTNSKGYGWGALMGGLFLLVVALRDVGILGVLVTYLSNTVFETVQLLDAFGFLSRVEILFIFMHVVCVSYVMCLCTGASTDVITYTFPLKNKKNSFVILALIAAIMVASVFVFRTSAMLREFIKNILPFISVWFVVIIPAVALVFGKIRSRGSGKM